MLVKCKAGNDCKYCPYGYKYGVDSKHAFDEMFARSTSNQNGFIIDRRAFANLEDYYNTLTEDPIGFCCSGSYFQYYIFRCPYLSLRMRFEPYHSQKNIS